MALGESFSLKHPFASGKILKGSSEKEGKGKRGVIKLGGGNLRFLYGL